MYTIHITSIANVFLNLFFRKNNLLIAYIKNFFTNNKIIIGKNVKLRNCIFEIHGSQNIITIGDNCILWGTRIYTNCGNNKLFIGKGTKINASKNQRTTINPCNGSEIYIGNNCLLSNSIELHTTDYHKIISNGKHTNPSSNIYIGNNCWIGLQCLILKGTILADNTIVGARSLVNKKFDESKIVIVGNPAQIIKRNVIWEY